MEAKGNHCVLGLAHEPSVDLPRSLQPRQNLLQAAGLVGQTSGELLQQIGESDTDPRFQVSVPGGNQGCTLRKTISLCTGPDRRAPGQSLASAWR